jgi:Tol biopolymer transport system component
MRMFLLVASLWLAASPLWGKIAFYSNRDGNYEIYTMDSDGSNQTRLTFNDAADTWPAWSPNGQQIAFVSNRDGNYEIYVMDVDGTNQRRLTNDPASDTLPYWSPDGNQIAFDSTKGAKKGEPKLEIYVMDADGSNVKRVTNIGFVQRPRWSPDGEWILFMGVEVFAIRPNGTDMWQISNPRDNTAMFLGGWSPDGKQVLYTEAVDLDIHQSFPVIATLDDKRPRTVLRWKHVRVPEMAYVTDSFGADGKSILFSGSVDGGDNWHIYRFELISKKLIQLTNSPGEDTAPQEWDPRLSVPPQQGLLPQQWGEIKAEGLLERRSRE